MSKELIKGNVAAAEAAVRAGMNFFAGYPITPSTEILEYLSHRLPELGRVFVQKLHVGVVGRDVQVQSGLRG